MGRPTTLNPRFENMGKSKRKCWGCNMKPINRWCPYRWWRNENRKGYSFRVFTKVHLLPSCTRENWDYPERNEFVKKYCEEIGLDYSQFISNGGGRGGRGRVATKPMMI
jgi:hypothetical protein